MFSVVEAVGLAGKRSCTTPYYALEHGKSFTNEQVTFYFNLKCIEILICQMADKFLLAQGGVKDDQSP